MAKKRKLKLIDGRVVEETAAHPDPPIDLTISTRCPDKWLFVDLETGDVWRKHANDDAKFVAADQVERNALMLVAKLPLR